MYEQEQKAQQEQQRAAEARQVQEELERQIRQFGGAVTDAFQHGFEGRGQEIGDRAWDIGRAVVNAANFGLSEAGRAIREEQEKQRQNAETVNRTAADIESAAAGVASAFQTGASRMGEGASSFARQVFGAKPEPSPAEKIRASAGKLFGTGLAMVIVGGVFAFGLGVGGISCLVAAGAFAPSTALADALAADALLGAGMEAAAVVGGAALSALEITGGVLSACTLPFLWMIPTGAKRIKASRRLKQYAEMADSMNTAEGMPLRMVADMTHQKPKKLRKELRRFMKKGWLTAWLDEKSDRLFLTAEDYRAAQEARTAAQRAAQAEQAAKAAAAQQKEQPSEDAPAYLEAAQRFAAVLEQEKQLMRDEQAVAELEKMQKTTRSICAWLEGHPESLPKARRFAEYYIPTTLKLLHTYNDVQGQQGENAETIRRDIAGILHTLNMGYENLYNNLLSDVAMDISGEIAALQGMLANDGLTGEEML